MEHLKKIMPTVLRTSMIDLYDNTGKEESNFFPLLNYTAMEILGVSGTKACERNAMDWINENLDYVIKPSFPSSFSNCTNTDFVVLPIIKEGKVRTITLGNSTKLTLGNATKFKGKVLGMSLVMHYLKNGKSDTRLLTGFSSQIMRSLDFILSDTFGEIISNLKKELDAFPSLKQVLRSAKEYKAPNIAAKAAPFILFPEEFDPARAMPFSVLSDAVRKRYGDDIIFPLIPDSSFFFNGEAYICHYNALNGTCTIFNENLIMGLPYTDVLMAKEVDEFAFRNLVRGYKSVIDYMRGLLDSLEAHRNNLLKLL